METEKLNNPDDISGSRKKKEEIKDFLKFIENECTAYPNLWDTEKAVLRRKSIVLNVYI